MKRCILILLALPLILAGCATSRVVETVGSGSSNISISDVTVTTDKAQFDPDTVAWYRQNAMSGTIRAALLKELRTAGRLSASPYQLQFAVTDFRLRSNAQVLWVGVMAGKDYLTGTVSILQGGKVVRQFEVTATGSDSAWSALALGRTGNDTRADMLANMIAKQLVAQL
jgi:hypothetical protein